MDEQTPETPTLPQRQDRGAGKAIRRRRLLKAQDFCASIAFDDELVRKRYRFGMRVGDLPPAVERAVLEIAYGRAGEIDKRLTAALDTGRGLTILLRNPLTADPLSEPKPVGSSSTIEQPAQEPPALMPRTSIVPPSRPNKKAQGKGRLGANEEELR